MDISSFFEEEMDSSKPLESLDMDELTDWLMEKDIPYKFCKILEGKSI